MSATFRPQGMAVSHNGTVTIIIARQCSLINTANRHFSECLINKSTCICGALRGAHNQVLSFCMQVFRLKVDRGAGVQLVAIELAHLCCGQQCLQNRGSACHVCCQIELAVIESHT